MLYLIILVLGILAGLAKGGKLSNLLNIRFSKVWIIFLAFIIQLSAQILSIRGFQPAIDYSIVIYAVVYGLLITGLIFNRRYLGMLFVALGAFSNAVTILLNGGKMPVAQEAAVSTGIVNATEFLKAGSDGKHIIIDGSTRLSFLSDVIVLPPYIGAGMQVISIGDVVIGVGLFLIIFQAVSGFEIKSKKQHNEENIKFDSL